jgi:acylglycerol lipase
VAERLADAGYATYALDHRGHGRSSGDRALIDRLPRAIDDIETLRALAAGRHPGLPVFLLGHSMGGCLSLVYAQQYQDRLTGLALSAPAATLASASPIVRVIGAVLSAVAPKVGVFDVDPSTVSRDPQVVRDYASDPLNYHRRLPARTVDELAGAIRGFPERVPELTVPLLVMYGTGDELVPPEGSVMVHERAGSEDKRIISYEGLYHEILNEPERDQVMADLIAWLDEHVADR